MRHSDLLGKLFYLLFATGLALPSLAQFDPARARPEPAAVAARYPDPGPEGIYPTPGFKLNRSDFTGHDEAREYLRSLQNQPARRDVFRLEIVGQSQQGRGIPLVILGAANSSTPAPKPTVLILGQQHGNEPAGGEAALALAERLSNPNHPDSALLQHVNVLIMPRANPDAAHHFQRATASGLDVNRDHLLLQNQGHSAFWYHTSSTDPQDRTVSMGGVQADTGRNVYGLRHAVSLLIETRGVGIGRAHYARRVHSHVTATRAVLQTAARLGEPLQQAVAQAGQTSIGLACQGELVVRAQATPERQDLLLVDALTGQDRLEAVDWRSALALNVTQRRPRPCGYWLAADELAAVHNLQALGIAVHRLPGAIQTPTSPLLAALALEPDSQNSLVANHVLRLDNREGDAAASASLLRVMQPLPGF